MISIDDLFNIRRDYHKDYYKDKGDMAAAVNYLGTLVNSTAYQGKVKLNMRDKINLLKFLTVFVGVSKDNISSRLKDMLVNKASWQDIYEIFEVESDMLVENLFSDAVYAYEGGISEVDKGWSDSQTLEIDLTNDLSSKIDIVSHNSCNASCMFGDQVCECARAGDEVLTD